MASTDPSAPSIELRGTRQRDNVTVWQMRFAVSFLSLSGTLFTATVQYYEVYIRGQFFCLTRYSDFASLYDALFTEFEAYAVTGFPPKKPNLNIGMLTLSSDAVDVRRRALEDFFQKGATFSVSLSSRDSFFPRGIAFEVPQISDAPFFIKFFYDARASSMMIVY